MFIAIRVRDFATTNQHVVTRLGLPGGLGAETRPIQLEILAALWLRGDMFGDT